MVASRRAPSRSRNGPDPVRLDRAHERARGPALRIRWAAAVLSLGFRPLAAALEVLGGPGFINELEQAADLLGEHLADLGRSGEEELPAGLA